MSPQRNGNTEKDKDTTTAVKETAKETAAKVQDKAKDVAETVKAETGDITTEAKQQAKELTNTAVDEARSRVATQKDVVAEELHGVASALRETGKQLRSQDQAMFARYSNEVAGQVDRVSTYLEEHDLDDIVGETKDFARRQPELFLGGAFTLGLLAARFIKSSAPSSSTAMNRNRNYRRNTAGYGGRFAGYDNFDQPGRFRDRYTGEEFGTGRPVERGTQRYPTDPYPTRYDSEAAETAREDWTS
jgi:hypothetical protein